MNGPLARSDDSCVRIESDVGSDEVSRGVGKRSRLKLNHTERRERERERRRRRIRVATEINIGSCLRTAHFISVEELRRLLD